MKQKEITKNGLSDREWLFCRLISESYSPQEAAVKSGLGKTKRAAYNALRKGKLAAAISEMTTENLTLNEAANALRRLCFGSVADVVRLVTSPEPASLDLDSMELGLISEIKFSKNGMEVKLCDRVKALGLMCELAEDGDAPDIQEFLSALKPQPNSESGEA